MSVEAQGWAFRQNLPAKPKMVLLALADQTDERTGRVCYGKTDMAHLARKANVPERTLARYIPALTRNGYIRWESGKDAHGRQRANQYWLCLDRIPSESLNDWTWRAGSGPQEKEETDDDETQDVVAPDAMVADGEPVENYDDRLPPNGSSPSAIGGSRELPKEPKNLCARAREVKVSASSFSRKAQDAELENLSIQKVAEKANAKSFVIEDSRAWIDWCAWRRRRGLPGTLPKCSAIVQGVERRGWWMPSLFPPQSTGPPPTHELSEEDSKALEYK